MRPLLLLLLVLPSMLVAACQTHASRAKTIPAHKQEAASLTIQSIAVMPGVGNSPFVRQATAYIAFRLGKSGQYRVIWPYNVMAAYGKATGRELAPRDMSREKVAEAGRLIKADAVLYTVVESKPLKNAYHPLFYSMSWRSPGYESIDMPSLPPHYTWIAATLIRSIDGVAIASSATTSVPYRGYWPRQENYRQAESVAASISRGMLKALEANSGKGARRNKGRTGLQ